MQPSRFRFVGTVAALTLALGACSSQKEAASHAGAEIKNAVSPIVGSWTINGDVPPPKSDLPQFVRLTFAENGKLAASYVAAGGALAGIMKSNSKLKSETDSYTLDGSDGVTIIEGSRALTFRYAVRDGKLFLTPQGASTAMVYQHVS